MALYAGRIDEFAFRTEGRTFIVSGPEGEDRLVDVEILAFAGNRDFIRVSDLSGDSPIGSLSDLLAAFDSEQGSLADFF